MKQFFTGLFLFSISLLSAQSFQINYDQYSNGKKNSESDISMTYTKGIVFLSKPDAKISAYIDYNQNQNVSMIRDDGKLFKTLLPFDSLPQPVFEEKSETLLGFDCKYAYFFSFSNKIEVWYTEESIAKGSPYSRYLPSANSLILKIVINGNRTILAKSIDEIDNQKTLEYPIEKAIGITGAEFEELKIKSRYRTVQVFDEETVNFINDQENPNIQTTEANKTYHFSKGTLILKKISLTEELNNSDYVFAKLNSWSNGDAYDRTGSVFIIPSSDKEISMLNALQEGLDKLPVYTDNIGQEYQGIISDANYNTPVELMRFFTSFGARHFNNLRPINNYSWKDAVVYNQEVTSLIPNNQDEIWIGVFIGNYDKGGHKVSLELNYYPAFESHEKTTRWLQPLVNTLNILEMSGQNYGKLFKNDTLRVNFEITEDIQNIQLLYTATGHGGWGGGDEFNPKLNQLFLDGKPIFSVVPWRTDCASYRMSNPASGNFENGLSSSDFSRSNWCPANLTPPYVIPLKNLAKGRHIIEIIIDQGDDEGTSFNHWSVSGVLVGDLLSAQSEAK